MMLVVLDTEGVDIGPLVEAASAKYAGLTTQLLLAMLKAESGLKRTAAREGSWPDVSYGYSQLTVSTAEGYGIGNGEDTPSNRANVREVLFDRATSIDMGARHLSGCVLRAAEDGYVEDELLLEALIAYNSGSTHPRGDWYWTSWPGNVRNYQFALEWAKEVAAVW